ncbi:MAG TPA: NTP transferase domain-containing protein [Mycobacteriales bacterium]|nr:NTP transferase domain-containing protein [Mycobacteriales bacterium]
MTPTSYDAVVLAGGRARRMGGVDKTRLEVAGVALLDRVLLALSPDADVVVVGDERPTVRPVQWTCEQPIHSGPAAAVAAALPRVARDQVVLLAGDLPLLTAEFVERLVASTTDDRGAVPVDDEDFPQWLCSAWPSALLRSVDWSRGSSLRGCLGGLPFHRLAVDGESGATPNWVDCDTPEDLERAREKS